MKYYGRNDKFTRLSEYVREHFEDKTIDSMITSIMARQSITRQWLDKHLAIPVRKNRTNVYSSLLGNSQRANGLARYLSRDLFSVWSALRDNKAVFSALSVPRLYNTSPPAAKEIPGGLNSWEYNDKNGACP
jgi:hypothetical protein